MSTMKSHTAYLTLKTKERYEMVHLTSEFDGQRSKRVIVKVLGVTK